MIASEKRPPRSVRANRAALAAAWCLLAFVLLAALGIATVVLASGRRFGGLRGAVLNAPIADGIVPVAVYVLAAGVLGVLLVRRWRRGSFVPALVGALSLAGVAAVLLVLADAQNWFGVALDAVTWVWAIATFAAVGLALGTLVSASAWRRLVAVSAVVVLAAAGTVGINAHFGIEHTLAELTGITVVRPIALPHTSPAAGDPPGELWQNWTPPAGMPAAGTTGTVDIPATVSGFRARPAGVYLPPAARVPHPPALPLVVMLMGQPGSPDPSFIAAALDAFAARHDGLAPIVVVADQLGDPTQDPLCLDTARYGKVETYITRDVLPWARAHLNVAQDRAHTLIAGYSNGGECALSFGAKFPELWANVLDISGEAYPGSDHAARTLADDFAGDKAAYQATWPATILAAGSYPDSFGVFTVGSDDASYRTQAQQMTAAAKAAGWQTDYVEIPNGGHVAAALRGGLAAGFAALYPRLGLSRPGVAP